MKNPIDYKFTPKYIDRVESEKRSVIDLLPRVHQTNTLKKFFSSTIDNLFSAGKAKSINGYIGQKPSWWDKERDFYLTEPDDSRKFYQLEPAMISKASDLSIQSLLFYDDFIKSIEDNGGNTSNHSRLFSSDYYSWCPPIDIDAFLNFRNYYWIDIDFAPITIIGDRNVYVGDGITTKFSLPNDLPIPETEIIALVDGVSVTFSYVSGDTAIELDIAPEQNSTVEIYGSSDIDSIVGQTSFTFLNSVKLSSGQRIRITNDKNTDNNDKIFIVEGVGEYIVFVPDDVIDPSVTTRKDYITIQRGSTSNSVWSSTNRWFHIDTLLNKESISDDYLKSAQANRPIIQFDKNLKLYDYGTTRRRPIDLVDTVNTDILSYIGTQTMGFIDGVEVNLSYIQTQGSIRLLVTKDNNPLINNKIFLITVIDSVIQISVENDGEDINGAPTIFEMAKVVSGTSYQNKEVFFDGIQWKLCQQKNDVNIEPLFDLYDFSQNSLTDTNVYPSTSFKGSKIFGYAINTASPIDTEVNKTLKYDNNGEVVFENYLATEKYTYFFDNRLQNLTGYFYYYDTFKDTFQNNWFKRAEKSSQKVVDEFVVKNNKKNYKISQNSATNISTEVYKNQVLLEDNTDYIINDYDLILGDVQDTDIITVKTLSNVNESSVAGFYEIPINLSSNPSNEQVVEVSKGDVYSHFSEIIRNQVGFVGKEYDRNNWRDIAKNRGLGTQILQHSSSLLKAMLLSASTDLDLIESIDYSESEYVRWRNKFEQKIQQFYNDGTFTDNDNTSDWIEAVVQEINIGKTKSFPFYYSGLGKTPSSLYNSTYSPANPSYLGVYPLYTPTIFFDDTLLEPKYLIQLHDGSIIKANQDFRDTVILAYENRILESIQETIKAREVPFFDVREIIGNKSRAGLYSKQEFNDILKSYFEKWCSLNGLNYRKNTTFNPENPFTWNWSSVDGISGEKLHGNWRQIYQHYYDTDRPHTHPWEMLGFTIKPLWWDSTYGFAPYTKNNTILWNDIASGTIRFGQRQGINENWAKPYILSVIPVDDAGNLLNPLEAGIAKNEPSYTDAAADWQFGDGGAIETSWRRSSIYPFIFAKASYLIKPSDFVEYGWETDNIVLLDNNQIINDRTQQRLTNNLYVHGELDETGSVAIRHGIQQWVSDRLTKNNKDIKGNFGDFIRGLDVKLVYRFAGFTNDADINVISDNLDKIPDENTNILLYKSPVKKQVTYSGVIIEKSGNEFYVYGYDILYPWFNVINGDTTGESFTLTTNRNKKVKIPSWKPNTYYSINNTVLYKEAYYSALKTHTSSSTFEESFWKLTTSTVVNDSGEVAIFSNPNSKNEVTKVNYGTKFRDKQEVANFLYSYSRYLESVGFDFNFVNIVNQVEDWKTSILEYLDWCDLSLVDGNIITVSPASQKISYTTSRGNIENVETLHRQTYGILDKRGLPIPANKTFVTRNDGNIEITPQSKENAIFFVRLLVTEIEHCLLLDNRTVFGDIVYDPILGVRQPRLRVQGLRSIDWTGRINAPGYIVSGSRIIPNFENTTNDFRNYFEIEGSSNTTIKELSRHNINYQDREYLNNLLINPTNQFEFYQGMIGRKGTVTVLDRILRSDFINYNTDIDFLEEWAVRTGDYGSEEINQTLEIQLKQEDYKNDPQLIEFNSENFDSLFQKYGLDYRDTVSDKSISYSLDIQATPHAPQLEVVFIKTIPNKSVIIKNITVKVKNYFDGSAPKLTIGNAGNTSSVLPSIDLSSVDVYKFNFNTNDVLFYTKATETKLYFTGLATVGSITVEAEIEYPQEYFDGILAGVINNNYKTVNDFFSNDGVLLNKDSSWNYRHTLNNVDWEKKKYSQKEKSFLPTAGYARVDDTQWQAPTYTDFDTLFYDTQVENPSVEVIKQETFNKTTDTIIRKITKLSNKPFRIKKITVDVSEEFLTGTSIKIRKDAPNGTILYENSNLQFIDTIEIYPYVFLTGDVYIEYTRATGTLPLLIGNMVVSIAFDVIESSILVDDRVWVYSDYNTEWNIYQLTDTNYNIVSVIPPITETGGSLLLLDKTLSSNVSVDTVNGSRKITENDILILDGVDNLNPTLTNTVIGKSNNSLSVLVRPSTYTDPLNLMTLVPEAGMTIDKITISNVIPLSDSTKPQITLGTSSNPSKFVNGLVDSSFNSQVTIDSTEPVFSFGDPIQVEFFDTDVKIIEGSTTVPIEIIRRGGIYQIPSNVQITNAGSGYEVAPNVVINGIQGVKATANISGYVANVTITNSGFFYTTPPEVYFVGGDGTAAQAYATIADGEVTGIVLVPVGGTGFKYKTPPKVIISGGGGYGATAEAIINYSVEYINIDTIGSCNYTGTPITVDIDAPTSSIFPNVPATADLTLTDSANQTRVMFEVTNPDNSVSVYGYTGGPISPTIVGNGVQFNSPNGSVGDWRQIFNLPIPTSVTQDLAYKVKILTAYDVVTNELVVFDGDFTTFVTVLKAGDIDLTTATTYTINNIPITDNDDLLLTLDADGNNGLINVTIDYSFDKALEIFNNYDKTPFVVTDDASNGDIFSLTPLRYTTLSDRAISGRQPIRGWKQNDITFVDNIQNPNNYWGIYKYTTTWVEELRETTKANQSVFSKSTIYDNITNSINQTLQVFDPRKGYIPGVADKEITYKIEYDPAIYSTSTVDNTTVDLNRNWNSKQIGLLWWDVSTVRYYEYESFDDEYKWKNWGKLLPKTSIDIYEWTKSPVLPSEYAALVEKTKNSTLTEKYTGIVKDVNSYSEAAEWNDNTKTNQTFYYFWVKDSQKTNIPQRSLTAQQVSNIIRNPNTSNIPWFAAIDTNKILIGGVGDYLNDTSSILSLNWNNTTVENSWHKEYTLIGQNSKSNDVPNTLWKKLTDSLVGWDNFTTTKETTVTTTTALTPLSIELRVTDASGLLDSGEVTFGNVIVTYKSKSGNTLQGISSSDYRPIGATGIQTVTLLKENSVPQFNLTKKELYGINFRPRQTMFIPEINSNGRYSASKDARKTFIESLNSIFLKYPIIDDRLEWADIFEAEDTAPLQSEYAFEAETINDRNILASSSILTVGLKVFIRFTPEYFGFWTLWKYQPLNPKADSNGFVLDSVQKFKNEEGYIWNRVDWYEEGFDNNDTPAYFFNTKQELYSSSLNNSVFDTSDIIAEVKDNGTGRWEWFVNVNGSWKTVAREKSTIQLTSVFYDTDKVLYGFYGNNIEDIYRRDGSYELKFILDNLKDKLLLPIEKNDLFITMIKKSYGQGINVDWAFKTSFMKIAGTSNKLIQSPVTTKNKTTDIISFVNEVKPYHVKIRDFKDTFSSDIDNAIISAVDFDNPLYFDTTTSTYRNLDVNNPTDVAILQTEPYLNWYNNYTKTNNESWDINWNPVRKMKTSIVFDRNSSSSSNGWGSIPFDAFEVVYVNNRIIYNFRVLEQEHRSNTSINYNDRVVNTLLDRDALEGNPNLISGTIVYVKDNNRYYMRDNVALVWKEFFAIGWDSQSGAYDRIMSHYLPDLTEQRKTANLLISGSLFRGTTIRGNDFEQEQIDCDKLNSWDNNLGWDTSKVTFVDDEELYVDLSKTYRKNNIDYLDKTVSTIQERNFLSQNALVVNGTIVTVTLDPTQYFMWDTLLGDWREFYTVAWDSSGDCRFANKINIASYIDVNLIGNQPNEINGDFEETDTGTYSASDILVNGGQFTQSRWDSDRPEELVKSRAYDPLFVNFYQKTDTDLTTFISGLPAWTVNTVYNKGDIIKNANKIYTCVITGTSSAIGTGPSATTSTLITDGTVSWKYNDSTTANVNYYPNTRPLSFEMFKSSLENWSIKRKLDSELVLDSDILVNSQSITVEYTGGSSDIFADGILHNPENPSVAFVNKLRKSFAIVLKTVNSGATSITTATKNTKNLYVNQVVYVRESTNFSVWAKGTISSISAPSGGNVTISLTGVTINGSIVTTKKFYLETLDISKVPGIINVSNEKILYWKVVDNLDGTYELKDIERGYAGTMTGISSKRVRLTHNSVNNPLDTSTYAIPTEWTGDLSKLYVYVKNYKNQTVYGYDSKQYGVDFTIINNEIKFIKTYVPQPSLLSPTQDHKYINTSTHGQQGIPQTFVENDLRSDIVVEVITEKWNDLTDITHTSVLSSTETSRYNVANGTKRPVYDLSAQQALPLNNQTINRVLWKTTGFENQTDLIERTDSWIQYLDNSSQDGANMIK